MVFMDLFSDKAEPNKLGIADSSHYWTGFFFFLGLTRLVRFYVSFNSAVLTTENTKVKWLMIKVKSQSLGHFKMVILFVFQW